LKPEIFDDAFIAPNASIIGEVSIGLQARVWYGAVLRGDINAIRVGNYSSIGDNTVIHTAAALPTGIPASVNIGIYVTIENGCSLYSCTIDDEVVVGFRSVILEGAQLERGCQIGPNSVVPPGRVIPAGQFWAGNPVEYVRDVTKPESSHALFRLENDLNCAYTHSYELMGYSNAYLTKSNKSSDQSPSRHDIKPEGIKHEEEASF